ncbi:MAG: hypothetical protein IID28_03960 [Planctomycetes bacterium]|nr:hypothetical protein [Planctomycetota bacterium]
MRRRAPRMVTVILLLAGFAASSAGCYERVIRAEGLGSRSIDTYEPNARDQPDLLDEIMWGDQRREKKKKR